MRVRVLEDVCQGHTLCAMSAPEIFDLREEDGHAVVTVTDTGMGIEPDDLEQLSERFFRSKMATRQAIKGVGLGLSITKAIVTAHDGTMSATSAVGEGTQFRIALPARPN